MTDKDWLDKAAGLLAENYTLHNEVRSLQSRLDAAEAMNGLLSKMLNEHTEQAEAYSRQIKVGGSQ